MATKIDLCNGAMIKLSKKPSIASLDPGDGRSSEERVFMQSIDRIIKNSIRKYRPNCCVARAILSQDPMYKPRWDFPSAYKYPANMVKLLDVDNNTWLPAEFPIEGKWILARHLRPLNPGDTAKELRVKYLENKPVTQFDEDFANLCMLELAVECAPAIDLTREAFVIALRDSEADRWAADNAMENGFVVIEEDPFYGTIREIRS